MIQILLDTNICIYLIKNNPPSVRERFEEYGIGDIGISSITIAELAFGVCKSKAVERNSQALEAFLLPLEFLDFDYDSARVYGEVRADLEGRGQLIGSMDMLIASQAIAHNLLLVTHNLREFERVPRLRCESWVG